MVPISHSTVYLTQRNVFKKDTVPLIDHSEFKQHNKRVEQIIKVVVTIVDSVEDGIVKGWISTVLLTFTSLIIAMKCYPTLEHFHTDDSESIIKNLQQKNTTKSKT